MRMKSTILLIAPDAFTGLLITVVGFLLVSIFNKAVKAFETLTDLRMSGGLIQQEMKQAQKDIEQGKRDNECTQIEVENLAKDIAEIKHQIKNGKI